MLVGPGELGSVIAKQLQMQLHKGWKQKGGLLACCADSVIGC